jgi:hypothetical protein
MPLTPARRATSLSVTLAGDASAPTGTDDWLKRPPSLGWFVSTVAQWNRDCLRVTPYLFALTIADIEIVSANNPGAAS